MKLSRLLLIVLVAILASCQKEIQETPPPPEEVTTKMLKEYKYYDYGDIQILQLTNFLILYMKTSKISTL